MRQDISVAHRVMDAVNVLIYDKPLAVRLALSALLAGGHILIEDVPGMGKTSLARAFAHHLNLAWKRLQCTNDTIPADIMGANIFHPSDGRFTLHKGVVFSELLLVDELNRAPSKSQSALLEAMAERQVTIDGEIYPLPAPFIVIATQNPLEQIGVSPLPESQLDRFAVSFSLGLPAARAVTEILRRPPAENNVAPILKEGEFLTLMNEVDNVFLAEEMIAYLQECALQARMRLIPNLSMRALLYAKRLAQAHALIEQRDYVVPEDIQIILPAAWRHRASTRQAACAPDEMQFDASFADILHNVSIPSAS